MTEYESRWDGGRSFFASKRDAIRDAQTRGPTARVLHWGNGAIVWEAKA